MVDKASKRSIVEQIVDQWLMELEEKEGFDAQTIGKLKELASSQVLARHSRLVEAIRTKPAETHHETH